MSVSETSSGNSAAAPYRSDGEAQRVVYTKSDASEASRLLCLKVLLFDLGDTLVQHYRREQFPPLLPAEIQAVRRSLRRAGGEMHSGSEIERVVAAENHEARNCRVCPLHKRLGRSFYGHKHRGRRRMAIEPALIPFFPLPGYTRKPCPH